MSPDSASAGQQPPRRFRRGCLRAAAAGLLVLLVLLTSGLVSGCGLRVSRHELPIAGLHAGLDGLCIAQVSDLHYSGPARVHRSLQAAIDAAAPDIVAFTGDYVESTRYVEPCADLIARLAAGRAAFVVPGNWEYWSKSRDEMIAALEKRGVHVLLNRSEVFVRSGARLRIAGVDDPFTKRDDLAAALAGVPAGEPVVLLAHSPDVILGSAARRAGLILAGHTHGGQVRVFGHPVVRPRVMRSDLVAGLHREGDTWLYVNTGIGTSAVPVRFFCPPELTLVTLRRADG